jgi:phospholipase C
MSRGSRRLTRRGFVRAGAGLAAAGTGLTRLPIWQRALASTGVRKPGSLPDPRRPAGAPTELMPFDHVVVVMMENHSFDNYFGMLPRRGHPRIDGFSFDRQGRPSNRQPYQDGYVTPVHATSMCQPEGVDQTWRGTHIQIDGGKMDGFPQTSKGSMLYWDESDLPFYYSLAKTFTVGERWFCSAPCQTFPNRRFLLGATADGLIATDTTSVLDDPPPSGTIFDHLNEHGIGWTNYFSDLPATGVWYSIPRDNLDKIAPVAKFYADCAAGTLPSVSFVDPEFGALSDVMGGLSAAVEAIPQLAPLASKVSSQGGDEENPQNIEYGEAFCASVIDAVIKSPAWPRTLLIWTYDEHGGYFDHVPPPATLPPDSTRPRLGPNDPPGGYDLLGPRVPSIVVSPYSKPGGITRTVHDHTSVLATIEAKWNLPALTYRDANATTVMDFLDTRKPRLLRPPPLAAHGSLPGSVAGCSNDDPELVVRH